MRGMYDKEIPGTRTSILVSYYSAAQQAVVMKFAQKGPHCCTATVLVHAGIPLSGATIRASFRGDLQTRSCSYTHYWALCFRNTCASSFVCRHQQQSAIIASSIGLAEENDTAVQRLDTCFFMHAAVANSCQHQQSYLELQL